MSIGVHLLSLLAFPFIGLLYYYKDLIIKPLGHDACLIPFNCCFGNVSKMVIVGLPSLWALLDRMMVGLGLPFNSGLIPFVY